MKIRDLTGASLGERVWHDAGHDLHIRIRRKYLSHFREILLRMLRVAGWSPVSALFLGRDFLRRAVERVIQIKRSWEGCKLKVLAQHRRRKPAQHAALDKI